ncbi:MAG: homoserine dehydrogenase [Fusicatenibacter sp.]
MEERVIKVAMMGLGTVGTGVYKVLKNQQEDMVPKLGARVELKKILVRNLEKAAAKVDDPSILTNSFEEIANDPEIDIVIEVMGGKQPAMNYILACLDAGKNVVTANKDLVASEGKKLLAAAKRNGKDFLYEASVAGGIPIIRPIKQCLAGNHITEIMGIFNGTTNFILTKMTQEGMEFDEALRLAQDLGYAEADPTSDVEGLDAGRKVAILASAAFNSRVTFEDVYTEGIAKITATDIRYAKEMGCDIKLLGVAKDTPEGIEVRVHPMLIDSSHPLASVNDSYNAVFVTGDAVQDTMFYGRGAGELPTASAIVGDVYDIVRNILWDCCGRIGCTCYRDRPIKRVGEISSRYFVRMQIENRYGTLASVASVFGNNQVSIAQMVQKRVNGTVAEIVVITDQVKERHFMDAMKILGGMSIIKEISSVIRVYG